MLKTMKEDIATAFRNDPAARSTAEVVLCYPGLHAIWLHRPAHRLWARGWRLLPRLLSHFARFLTGVEIHPGARVGRRFFIDHGMGVVIGETAEVGADVLLYQGVVLGGTSGQKAKRHPTVESGVVVGAGAILLGPITVGSAARVGAGSVVIKSVAPGTTVVGVPGHDIRQRRSTTASLQHGDLPDPIATALSDAQQRYQQLAARVDALEREARTSADDPEPAYRDGGGI